MAVFEVHARDGFDALRQIPTGLIARHGYKPQSMVPVFYVFERIADAIGHHTGKPAKGKQED